MQIIIVGCGELGISLTAQLSSENNQISVIDTNYHIVKHTANTYDVLGIVGNGASYYTLSEADIEHTDLLIAVTESDELNLLCCIIAKKAGHCQTIARVCNPMYLQDSQFIREELDLSMIINPEFSVAQEISRLLNFPSAIEIDVFSNGYVEALSYLVSENSPLDGLPIYSLRQDLKTNILIAAVSRNNDVTIPNGNFILRSGDMISIIAPHRDCRDFFHKIGLKTKKVKNTILIGGSNISVYLTKMLEKMAINVKIIEADPHLCEELSNLLPHTTIIHGNGNDEALLDEERLSDADSVVTLIDSDEENILLSLYIMDKVNTKVVTKISRLQLGDVAKKLNLGSIVYPQKTTIETILRYVRATKSSLGSNIETLSRFMDNRVEALEFIVRENPKITNIPLLELSLKTDIIIGCILRGNIVIYPSGKDVIMPGDYVIVVSTPQQLRDIEDILA